MSGKQFKTYCKIIDYVDAVDPELATLIRALCVDMPLTSLRRKPGITFLMPQDKSFRAKLEKLAYSDNTSEATRAGEMLNALIIQDVFKTPAEWKTREVSNALFPSQIVDVDSVTTKEVIFKSGAKAVLDTDFRDASRKSNLAVWKLISGEIPVTTDKPAANKFVKKNKMMRPGKIGSYDPGVIAERNNRFKIAIAVENSYALSRLQQENHNMGGLKTQNIDVYLQYSLSLCNYIINVARNVAVMYERVLPILSFDKVDFYFLVEPHCANDNYLLDDNLINGWWSSHVPNQVDYKNICNNIEKLLESNEYHGNALVYKNRTGLLEKIADIRQQLSSATDNQPRSCVDRIEVFYKELESNNTIGGLGPILPEPLHAYYSAVPGLKMLQDELRYLTYGAFTRLESSAFDIGAYNELVNMIGECLHLITSQSGGDAHRLLNKNTIKYLISPGNHISDIKIFVYSTMFLFVPLTRSEAFNMKEKNKCTRPDPNYIVIFNIAGDVYHRHDRLLSASNAQSSTDLANALMSLGVDKLDPAVKEKLLAKLQPQ